jgi:hypothetical protein
MRNAGLASVQGSECRDFLTDNWAETDAAADAEG